MKTSTTSRVSLTIASAMLVAIIGVLLLSAALFLWFGYAPQSYDLSTGETTYRVLLGSVKMDFAIAEALGVTPLVGRFIAHTLVAAVMVLLAAFFLQLFQLVRAARRKAPFTARNACRLARMGWFLLIAFGPVTWTMWWFGGSPDSNAAIVDALFLLLGFVFIVLADVFRHGLALHADLEGTV